MPGRFDSVERRFWRERSAINLMEWTFNGKLMIVESFGAGLSDMLSKLYNSKWMRGVNQALLYKLSVTSPTECPPHSFYTINI